MKNSLIILLLVILFLTNFLSAQEGHEIKIRIIDFEETELYLAYHLGDKQFFADTTSIDDDGLFTFSGVDALKGGLYLVVLPPENNFFEILIDKNEQYFTITTNIDDLQGGMIFQGESFENQLFHRYASFVSIRQNQINKMITDQDNSDKLSFENQEKFDEIRAEITDYQKQLVKNYPNTLVAAITRLNLPIEYPEFKGNYDQIEFQRLLYTKEHLFDGIDLSDERLLRTPFLVQKIDYFLSELNPTNPDSLIESIDFILNKMDPQGENFKYFLKRYTNLSAEAPAGDTKKVYLHLVDTYYATGKAYWIEEENLKQMIESANSTKDSSEDKNITEP